MQPTIK